jgi:hypothetical protein
MRSVLDEDAVDRPSGFSDDDLALLFAEQHSDQRYVVKWGQWLS